MKNPEKPYVNMELDLNEDDVFLCLKYYLMSHVDSASYSLFLDLLEEGRTYEECVYNAIVNETIIEAIKVGIEAAGIEDDESGD